MRTFDKIRVRLAKNRPQRQVHERLREYMLYIYIQKDLIFMENMLRVGVVTSTHGVRGEVKVFPTTTMPSVLKS